MTRVLFAWGLMGVVVMLPSAVQAQSNWSGDLSIGATSVQGGSYSHRERLWWSGEVGYRLTTIGETGETGVILGARVGQSSRYTEVQVAYPMSVPCPSFGCRPVSSAPVLPAYSYEALTLGLRHDFTQTLQVSVDAGLGSVNAGHQGARLGVSRGVDVALRMGTRVWGVLRGQILSWTQAGNTLYAYPVTIGLRVW